MAASLRHAILSRMTEMLAQGVEPIRLLSSDAIRLCRDNEDRAFGTPKATAEVSGLGGGPLTLSITRTIVEPGGE